MSVKFTRHDPKYSDIERWRSVCQEDHYAVVSPSALGGLLAPGLLAKANNIVVMTAASGVYTVVVANVNRVDLSDSSIDQNPYIGVFEHSASSASGGYLHHGDWQGRTDQIDPMILAGISASGITAYFPLGQVPSSPNGELKDLAVDSQNSAFWAALRKLGRGPGEA